MNKKTAFQCQITLSPFCTVKLKHPTCRNKNEKHFRSSLSVSSCYSSCFSVTRQFVSGALGKGENVRHRGLAAHTENAASKRAICGEHVVRGSDGSMKQSAPSVSLCVSHSHFRNGPIDLSFLACLDLKKHTRAGQTDSDVPLRHFRGQSEYKG